MYTLSIESDPEPINPRTEYDNLGHMALFHKRYDLADKDIDFTCEQFISWGEMQAYIEQDLDAICVPVYMYDHSGITIRTIPFSCPWDSGQIGFVYVTRDDLKKEGLFKHRLTQKIRAKAWEILEAEVKVYNAYLSGEFYGYVIKDRNDEYVDSCWGFDDYDYCKQEGEAMLRCCEEKEAA